MTLRGIARTLVVVLALATPVAALALPGVLAALERGAQKRTMGDMRTVGTACESYSIDNNMYPAVLSIDALAPFLEPTYVRVMPRTDGWGRKLAFASSGTEYVVASAGGDGALTRTGVATSPNGAFSGIRRGDVVRAWWERVAW